MPLNASEAERADRLLKRTIAKRDVFIDQMQLLYDLAKKVEANNDVLPLFRARKKDVESLLTQFHAEQDTALDLLIQLQREDEYKKFHVPIGITISNQYYQIMAISEATDGTPIVPSNSITSITQEHSRIHLPTIQIPNFDGDIVRWIAFRDTFKSLVHDNSSLSNIEKFHYLLSAATSTASAVVRSIPLSDQNYEVAWKALNDRFDNPRIIMNAHLDKLFEFPTLRSSSLDDLKHFLNIFQENILALENFDIPNKEGYLLFYIATRVLDSNTKCLFESQHDSNTLPVIDDLLKYVKTRCQILQNSASSSTSLTYIKSTFPAKKASPFTKTSLVVNSSNLTTACPLCNAHHGLYRCEKFLQLSSSKRLKTVQTHRMCTNCLSANHTSSKCMSKYKCRQCSAKHHTLLHLENLGKKSNLPENSNQIQNTTSSNLSTSSSNATSVLVGTTSCTNLSVLGTALIRICDRYGHWVPVRALIDSGSQISAITHNCASRLGLKRRQSHISVAGLSQNPISHIKGVATCRFIPYLSVSPQFSCDSIILSKLTGTIPSAPLNPCIRSEYSDLQFADPSFDQPGRIDVLLGTDVYSQLFMDGYHVRHSQGLPSAFETSLGWIFVGTTSQFATSSPQVSLTLIAEPSINQLLQRFWKVEEPVVRPIPFTEEQKCEDEFSRTTTRDQYGRYTVSFPFKSDPHLLGESRTMALSRFLNLERKLRNDAELYAEYRSFMNEYIHLGHMHIATSPGKYIIPHHAVIKHINDKVKIRVVFDASARTTSGSSLNDILFTGPKLQQDISDLLIRCRFHRYMFTADICKMYRQINLNSAHQQYQHILWRNDPSDPLLEYALSTVTYGVACSPFQAIRVLHQLENDEGVKYPVTRGVLSTQTYVDDIITGEDTVESVLLLQNQIIQLLSRGGLELKKWTSNCPELLSSVPDEDRVVSLCFDPKDDSSVKILGLHWDPVRDVFSYHSDPVHTALTKRSVLSSIAKIYDPLGVLAPITFWAKCFMQSLWKEGYDWDHTLSDVLSCSWNQFAAELPLVSHVNIPRYIPINECSDAQLIGFSDASLKGYSAVIYLRLSYVSKPPTIHLLTAKSKVAPLKSGRLDESLSVPRLELCGALLLAQVLHRIQHTVSPLRNISSIHAWTDSTVVLSWLTSSQIQFKVFVTNRLNKIGELLPSCQWHHVATSQNPADCVSRGMFPQEALAHNLYWDGPQFLLDVPDTWSNKFNVLSDQDLPEHMVNSLQVLSITTTLSNTEWLDRFSSLSKLQRVVAYMVRFINSTRKQKSLRGYLSFDELEYSLSVVVRLTQVQQFHELRRTLAAPLATISPQSLARLSPYIDSAGIIRVGGRLQNSLLPESAKNPILLPKSCTLSILLIRYYHLQYLHAGPQLVSSLLSNRYWIISARSIIRQTIFKCVVCTRHRAAKHPPIMADLPSARVRPSRPFSQVGVDYAGPILIKDGKRRQARGTKCYIAIFVCMAIKAVHIEIVSDLSTNAFIASLHRFVSRRGMPSDIYSDCGTNFQGAHREIQKLFDEPGAQELFAGAIKCRWHFNPPASPHFGGLWEAAVKSCKYHLKRVIGSQILTFEEMSTLTSRIEAILNSRPLTPLSSDPHDLQPLTPGHFLIGSSIVSIPEPDLTSNAPNRLRRWHLLSMFQQSFWKRWTSEYLSNLQTRAKWIRPQVNVQVGDLVIVHAPQLPPTYWKLGRVDFVHPGADGVVRVVTVRTADGTYKRPVVKLTVLPLPDDPQL